MSNLSTLSLPTKEVLSPSQKHILPSHLPRTSRLNFLPLSYPAVPPLIPGGRSDSTLRYRHHNPQAELPRNLYVLNFPLDMDQ